MECSICNTKFTDGKNCKSILSNSIKGSYGAAWHQTVLLTSVQKKGKDLSCYYCDEVFENTVQFQEHKKSPEHKA